VKKVLILHTGGTLGMTGEPLEPDAYSQALTEAVPELTKLAEIDTRIVFNLDSSDVGPEHWTSLTAEIASSYDDFDGFVIVHGTDTMSYTASALAYTLVGLDKPVVLTGAQRPLSALPTDARRNLADAVELATRDIPEVGICFDGLFLRGCCSTKNNVRDYRAFDSPGISALARLGVDIDVGEHLYRSLAVLSVRRPGKFVTHPLRDREPAAALPLQDVRHLLAHGQDRIQAGHRVLHNHAHFTAATGVSFGVREVEHVLTLVYDLALGDARGWEQTHNGLHGHALSAARFADKRRSLTFVNSEVDPVDHLSDAVIRVEVDVEVPNLEERIPHFSSPQHRGHHGARRR
jgi:hypothetical protein